MSDRREEGLEEGHDNKMERDRKEGKMEMDISNQMTGNARIQLNELDKNRMKEG